MNNTIVLSKEKLAAHCKVSKELINEATIKFGMEGMDYVYDTLTAQIESFILARLNETQKVTVWAEKPTFWEWLTRKKRLFQFEINCKEVMKNPPKLKESVFIYTVKEQDEESN